MQSPTLMSFRKRLYVRGYREISITRLEKGNDQIFKVNAIEPLSGTVVSCEYDIAKMNRAFKKNY
jgi:hypothetical protein